MLDFFDAFPAYSNDLYVNKKMKTTEEIAHTSLQAAYKSLSEVSESDWNAEKLHEVMMALPASLSMKNGQVLFPIRLAVSGKQFTPGGAIEIADILGKEETLRRLSLSIQQLEK